MSDPSLSDAQAIEDLHRQLAAARAEVLIMTPRLLEFERLRREMRWDAAPRALRWLLPIARLLHRPEPQPAPATAAAVAPAMPSARTSRVRRTALAVDGLARPVVRPLAWRSRLFLTGELMRELADVRAKLDLALERLQHAGVSQSHAALDPGAGRVAERMLLTLALESREEKSAGFHPGGH